MNEQRKIIEGVPYFPFLVRFRTKAEPARRRQLTLWSPGYPWVRDEVVRTLDARVGCDNVKERSVSIDSKF